ncbi:MAG: nicotinate-nucleotide adenylyltransferase [Deltaproteobacteria bacterium]|nr:nicotinate-nucleotide adenylyltransferase [Deltaproteobacteria bacterium]
MLRVGILGGTFNPVHYGHLRLAEEALEEMRLDKVIFMPCYLPPHKVEDAVLSADARLRMVELAIEGNSHFEISAMELKRGGKSYSVDTIRQLKNLYGDFYELFFIIGMDSYVDIGSWKDYAELFAMTDLVVARRPGGLLDTGGKSPVELLPVDIRDEFCYDAARNIVVHTSGKVAYFLESTMLDISSTKLRKQVFEGKSLRYLVPANVESFIKERSLYRRII